MMWFRNLKMSRKLITGFLIVAIIAAVVGVVGIVNLSSVKQADTELYENQALALQYSGDTNTNFMQYRYFILKMTSVTAADELKAAKDSAIEFQILTDEAYAKLEQIRINHADAAALREQIKSGLADYKAHFVKYSELREAGKAAESNDLAFGVMAPLGSTLRDDLLKLSQYIADEAKKASENNARTAQTAMIVMMVAVAAAIAVSMVLGLAIARSISRPILKLQGVAELLSKGDIEIDKVMTSQDMAISQQKDEIGSLAGAFQELIETTKQQVDAIQKLADGDLTIEFKVRSDKDLLGQGLVTLVDNLNRLIKTIATSSEQVTSGSALVSNSSMALSQGATEQASSVEELTASLQEISAQTYTNAMNAEKANELATKAKENAFSGNDQMKNMLKAMEDINLSSSNINKIIKVIDDIAFQTNILALNAAVEAARAGQHGKGFAVVAEEVRTLAAKSASAAKETTELIENSIYKVETGTKIANETAGALGQIVEQVDKAAELVNSIALASKEQAHAIEQISLGITQVSQVVQTNAATAEESAAASEELSAQAEQLNETIALFKTKKSATTQEYGAGRGILNTQSKQKQLTGTAKAKITLNGSEFGKY